MNLARFLMNEARRVSGFTGHDWDRRRRFELAAAAVDAGFSASWERMVLLACSLEWRAGMLRRRDGAATYCATDDAIEVIAARVLGRRVPPHGSGP